MGTQPLTKKMERMPSLFDDFFKPWNEWFNDGFFGRVNNIPGVNITGKADAYEISLAAPGLKKEDFKIDVDGNMLTISSEKEESNEEKDKQFTRKEYNYASFSRSFTLPEHVKEDQIEAKYEDGILKIVLPRKEEAKNNPTRKIDVK
jgi:HSP20 family protein